ASGNRVLATGDVRVDVELADKTRATLWPELSGWVTGVATATGFAYYSPENQTLVSVGRFDGSFGATATHDAMTAWVRGGARRVARPGQLLGDADVRATVDRSRAIHANVTARPAAASVEIVAAADIKLLGETIDIRLGKHTVKPRIVDPLLTSWAGNGGALVIGPDKVELTGFATASGTGKAEVKTARYSRATGNLDAQLAVSTLPIGMFDPRGVMTGTVSGTLGITRKGLRWEGSGNFDAEQLVLGPTIPVIDGKLALELHGREVTLDVHGKSPQIGGARFELAVQGPTDILDPLAWQRLEASAIHVATITVEKVDLASQSPTGGMIDGKIQLVGATATAGTLAVRGVQTPLGIAAGDVTVTPLNSDLFLSWNANVEELGEASIGLRIAFPRYPFDPAAWRQLGRGMVKSLTASFDDIAFDPVKLAKLKINAPYRGSADVKLAVGPAATSATINVDVHTIEGGILRHPIDVHVETTTDGNGTTGSVCIARAKDKRGDACAQGGLAAGVATVPKLLAVEGLTLPITFSTWVAAPRTALAATLNGRLVIPSQSAPELAALFGRDDFEPSRGTIDGLVTVGGTLAKPTGKGDITAHNLKLISYIAGRDIPELTEMKISGNWDGVIARVDVTANESHGGLLASTISLRPDRIGDAVMSFRATTLDLAPLAAFLPGDLAASTGTMNGKLVIEGLDLATAKMEGVVRIDGAQIPIAPIIGTLRDASLKLEMSSREITLDARGLLNVCRDPKRPSCKDNITLKLKAPGDLRSIKGTLAVSKVAPIAEIEPIIDATAVIDLEHKPGARRWTGDITIANASVRVPPSVGDDLLEADDPEDVFFIEKPPPESSFTKAREVESRWLRANLKFANVRLEVEEYGAIAYLGADNLKLLVGDHIGLDGKIVIERGDAENIFGRQYQIAQHEVVTFERNLDPIVNLEMSHRFPELTLTMKVQGSPSDKEFPKPRFSSDNSQYSENQLFQIFLGASPSSGSDSTTQAREAAQNATTSVLSQLLLKRVKKYLPAQLKLDVVKCEPGTTFAGSSCTLGIRLLDGKLYIAGKHRLENPNVTENTDQIELQYYLSSEWYFEAVGGNANIIGTDLLWRRRWK
ncbi:MAG: translocation/assembly module TamB domain-containing protein, partial [Kofleriaceae bacterium]